MEKLRSKLGQVNAPTLLIWGNKDRVVSLTSGRQLQRKLRAELIVFAGGGHLVFEEFADEANRKMGEWLGRR